jgi:type IV pilus assembly protein PilW
MKHQQGMSLVELMVAAAMALVLVLGIGTVFLTMKQTFNLRQNMASTQSNQRIAMQFLSAAIRNAGGIPNPLTQAAPAQPLSGTGSNAGADTLTVQFWADASGAAQGCASTLTANHAYTDVFSVTGGYLSCTETDNTASPATSTTVRLIGGTSGSNSRLTGLNILYGIDPNGIGSSSRYVNAAAVTDWTTVKTVTFTLLFDAPLANKEHQTATSLSVSQTVPFMIGL